MSDRFSASSSFVLRPAWSLLLWNEFRKSGSEATDGSRGRVRKPRSTSDIGRVWSENWTGRLSSCQIRKNSFSEKQDIIFLIEILVRSNFEIERNTSHFLISNKKVHYNFDEMDAME